MEKERAPKKTSLRSPASARWMSRSSLRLEEPHRRKPTACMTNRKGSSKSQHPEYLSFEVLPVCYLITGYMRKWRSFWGRGFYSLKMFMLCNVHCADADPVLCLLIHSASLGNRHFKGRIWRWNWNQGTNKNVPPGSFSPKTFLIIIADASSNKTKANSFQMQIALPGSAWNTIHAAFHSYVQYAKANTLCTLKAFITSLLPEVCHCGIQNGLSIAFSVMLEKNWPRSRLCSLYRFVLLSFCCTFQWQLVCICSCLSGYIWKKPGKTKAPNNMF